MSKQKLVTFVLYMLMLTLGAAGIVTAFNGAGSLTLQPESKATAEQEAPAPDAKPAAEQTDEQALDYDWHEYGPFEHFKTPDGEEVTIDRLHVYFVTEDNIFRGRITALRGIMDKTGMDGKELNVQFVHHGTVVAATTLKSDGTFEIEGLTPGPYDIRVLSDNSLYLASFVLSTKEDLLAAGYSDDEVARVYMSESQRPFQLEAAGCIPDDYDLVVKLLNETYEFYKQADPPAQSADHHRLHIPKGTNFDAAQGGTSYLRHTVRLAEDGVLYGHLRKPIDLPTDLVGVKPIGPIEVFFLQHGQTVARVFTDEEGHFTIANLTPGNYSVVARSPYAVGVIGVRVIEFQNAAAGLNFLNEKASPAKVEGTDGETEATGGTIEPQSSLAVEHYTMPVSSLLQADAPPNLGLDMSLATPFELPVPPPEEEEEVVPFAGGGGGGGGGGFFFFPPFWWNDGDESNYIPANPPPPQGMQGPQGAQGAQGAQGP